MSHPSVALHTRICDTLGIQYPIVQAGMGAGITTPDLVAAVSNGGGLGILGAHLMPEDRFRAAIRGIKERTDRPFGVNFIVAPPETGHQRLSTTQQFLDRYRSELGLDEGPTDLTLPPSTLPELLVVAFEERVPVLSLGLGDPARFVEPAHEHGMSVIAMVSTVDEGRQAAASGVDVVAAQGAEAGGHRSNFTAAPGDELPQIGTFALVPQLVDAIDVPVLAAGGVMDGRGVAAALALGAEGVLMGTRFLTARESGTFDAYREALLQATEVDTVVSRGPTGRPARSLRNRLVEEMSREFDPLPYPLQGMAAMDIYAAAVQRDRADLFPLWAGQGLRLLTDGQSAQEIVSEIAEEATAVMTRLCGRVAN
jgi:nitronate monooxygenase